METFGTLTRKNNGTYGLPLTAEFSRPKEIVLNDVVYGRDIWRKWSDAELVNAGMIIIQDVTVVPAGEAKNSSLSDEFLNNRILRTYGTSPLSGDVEIRQLRGRVNGTRESVISAGIEIVVRGDTFVIQTDENSRNLLSGMMAAIGAGIPIPDGFSWRMADNTNVALTADEFKGVAASVLVHVNSCHVASRIHKDAIDTLTTWAEAMAYDLASGWPPVAPSL